MRDDEFDSWFPDQPFNYGKKKSYNKKTNSSKARL